MPSWGTTSNPLRLTATDKTLNYVLWGDLSMRVWLNVRERQKSNAIGVEHRVHPPPLQKLKSEKMSYQSQPLPLNHIRIINEPNSLS